MAGRTLDVLRANGEIRRLPWRARVAPRASRRLHRPVGRPAQSARRPPGAARCRPSGWRHAPLPRRPRVGEEPRFADTRLTAKHQRLAMNCDVVQE